MSMEVSGNYKDYKNDYLERLQEEKGKAQEAGKEQGAGNKSEGIPVPKDEYISSERSGSRPSGLYHMGKDENGNPKVLYDDPKKAGGADIPASKMICQQITANAKVEANHLAKKYAREYKNGQPKVGADSPEKDAEKCTTNTDSVDREIKKLKEQKQQLEQQIKAASGDEEKIKELEKKLSQVESELSQKDNDTYRRQNAVVS